MSKLLKTIKQLQKMAKTSRTAVKSQVAPDINGVIVSLS
jgi:uncharacterized FlaG/YvyC family protein